MKTLREYKIKAIKDCLINYYLLLETSLNFDQLSEILLKEIEDAKVEYTLKRQEADSLSHD